MERFYLGRGYLGKKGKFEKRGRTDRRVQMRGSSSETRSRRRGRVQKNGAAGKVYGKVAVWVR